MTFGTFSLQYHVAGVSQITGTATESFGQVAGDFFNLSIFTITIKSLYVLLQYKYVHHMHTEVKIILKSVNKLGIHCQWHHHQLYNGLKW